MGRALSAGVGSGTSGSYLVDLRSTEDAWKTLADDTPTPVAKPLPPLPLAISRPPQFSHQESGVDLAVIAAARNKSFGFVVQAGPRAGLTSSTSNASPASGLRAIDGDPQRWARAERQLWLAAGGLVGLAACVLALLGALTFGVGRSHAPAATSPTETTEAVAMPVANHPSLRSGATSSTGTARPPTPAHARASEPRRETVARAKHAKHRKAGKRAKRDVTAG